MVVSQTTSKLKPSRGNPISTLKDSIETEPQQQHTDFKKRYRALTMDQNRSKLPIRLIVTVVTVILCVVNVFWGVTSEMPFIARIKESRSDKNGDGQPNNALNYVSSAMSAISMKLRGSKPQNTTAVVGDVQPITTPVGKNSKGQTNILPVVNGKVGLMAKKTQQQVTPKQAPIIKKKLKKPRPQMVLTEAQTIPIYYVNLDAAEDRREYIESHLREQNLQAVRVAATDSSENITVGLVSPLTMVHPNDKELACIASHMIAIHKAVNDQSFFPYSPYAIIIEDDVRFEFPVNWNELLYNAPEDFDVLQLMTSNSEQVTTMAEFYDKTVSKVLAAAEAGIVSNFSSGDVVKHENLWLPRVRASNLWSTQAYAIRKDNVRRIINSLVRRQEGSGRYTVSLKNTPNQVAYCKELNARSCKLLYPFRLVADVYLYDLLGVAYTMRLPLFNGVSGYNSSIQTMGDKRANMSFADIGGVVNYVRKYSEDLLPSRLLLKSSNNHTILSK